MAPAAAVVNLTAGAVTPCAATMEYKADETATGSDDVVTVMCRPAAATAGLVTFLSQTVSWSPAADPATGTLIVAFPLLSVMQHDATFCPVSVSVMITLAAANDVPVGAATV